MSLRVAENYYFYGYEVLTEEAPSSTENSTAQVEETQTQTVAQRSNPKLPPIPNSVDFTALGIDTELKLARAAYMAAAAKAGIADVSAQRRFADQMIATNSSELKLVKGNVPLDDAKVKGRLMNREVNFTLSAGEKEALRQFRQQYVAENGRIRSNQKPTIDLRQAQTAEGVTPTMTTPVKTKFRVFLNNNGQPITNTRVLAQYAEDQYRGGNLWGENYRQIAELSAGQGVKAKITGTTYVGNKIAVDIELTPLDRAVVHENYKTVQAEVNRAQAVYRNIRDNNELASFLRGVFNGAVNSVKGTIDLVLDLPGTLKALWQVVTNPIETFNALKNELSETWEEFKNAPPSKKAEMVGELVGSAIVEILLGKGIGKAGAILAKTKTGAKLIDDATRLKNAGAVKLAETFSDEAAEIAKQGAKNRLRQLSSQLNTGLPIDPELLKHLTVFAGNKLKNGAISFKQFVAEAVKEFGDGIKGRIDDLAVSYRQAMRGLGFGDEIVESDVEQTSKLARMQYERETGAARQRLLEGIQQAENNGKLLEIKRRNPADYDWLQANPRHKELAYDPDTKGFKVGEAKVALKAEQEGLLSPPVRRAINSSGASGGGDYIDGSGVVWDVKEASAGVEQIVQTLNRGENVIVDATRLSESELRSLESSIRARMPDNGKRVIFVR